MSIDLRLDWANYKAAKFACENWHYSGCMPAGKLVKIGVWEDGRFIGVVIYGLGANPNLYKPYGIKQTECCELVRIALSKHKTEVTRIVKISFKLLKKACPKMRLIISFADQNQGHAGIIYQAGNWIYTGIGKSTPLYWLDGRWCHQRTVGARGLSTKKEFWKKDHIKHQKDKFRYVYALDKKLYKQIKELEKEKPAPVA